MASVGILFNKFLSIFLLLLHLGCFYITVKDRQRRTKVSPRFPSCISSSDRFKPRKVITSSWTFIKHLLSTKSSTQKQPASPTPTSARSSQLSIVSMVPLETHLSDHIPCQNPPRSCPESDISADNPFFPLRNDIFPCTACGEIFNKPQLLEQHQAIKHAVTELVDGDSGNNIVRIIFQTGWTSGNGKCPEIHRILKIHNSSKILSRFEEYREFVKVKAARNGAVRKRDERCIADGNELLRFSCSTFMCELGLNGDSSLCSQQYCTVCGIIKSGFSPKMDGIPTLSTSWRAHESIPEDIEEEFKFMNVKRAMLVCRVVAGRVGCESDDVEKEDGGFDSVVGRGGSGAHSRVDEEELLVFNPRAVLPCFVIVYAA